MSSTLLEEDRIGYCLETQEDGDWTYWRPESQVHKREIEMRVVKRDFEGQKKIDCQNYHIKS
jgi:hypothetical protein